MDEQHRLEQLAAASLTPDDCPPREQLALYMLRLLTGNDELRLAAHVRSCPICQHDIALAQPPSTPQPHPLERVIAQLTPFRLAEGRRGEERGEYRRYEAQEIQIDLSISAREGDYRRISGKILRASTWLAGCAVVLRSTNHRYRRTSNEVGFFSFDSVPLGHYTLTITADHLQVRIPDTLILD